MLGNPLPTVVLSIAFMYHLTSFFVTFYLNNDIAHVLMLLWRVLQVERVHLIAERLQLRAVAVALLLQRRQLLVQHLHLRLALRQQSTRVLQLLLCALGIVGGAGSLLVLP